MNIESIINGVLDREKGYVNDKDDPGGETNHGITVAVAREYDWTGPMIDLPVSLARKIYTDRYISTPKFDQIVAIDSRIGEEMIDTGVNMGPHRAAEFLQRWLNGFNDTGSRYQELFVDGRIGNVTLAALRAYIKWRGKEGVTVMLRSLNSVQGEHYLSITESKKSQRKYLYGWMLNRVEI